MIESSRTLRRIALLSLLGSLLTVPALARESGEPQRFHVIYPGQRLTSIAKRYKVSVEAIRYANGLSKSDRLKPGEKLTIPGLDDPDGSRARTLYPPAHPSDVVVPVSTRKDKDRDDDSDRESQDSEDAPRSHKVYAGQRLESIAKRYRVTVEALCAANGIKRNVKLHAGQVLTIPRPGDGVTLSTDADTDTVDKHGLHKLPRGAQRKSYVDLYTYSAHFRGNVLDKKGHVTPQAEEEICKLFGAVGTRPHTDLRLIRMVAKVSEKFGNRPIRIVSGYRTRSFFEDSRHKMSRAVDFSIPGIPNETIRDYLRSLPEVGVGYYPNSSFVHLDVRDSATYWVDYAGPGEAPRGTKNRDRDDEAEGDLHDPEVTEGDRPPATDDSSPPVLPTSPGSPLTPEAPPSGVLPSGAQNAPK